MKLQPDIDWQLFGNHMRAYIDLKHGTYDAFVASAAGINKGMLSRACNAHVLCAANFFHLCNLAELDAGEYFRLIDVAQTTRRSKLRCIADIVKNQSVTVPAKRETSRSEAN